MREIMMDELNTKTDVIDKLIKQCEQSKLASFAYQDAIFSIHFSKVETEVNYNPNVFKKVANENSSEYKSGNIEIDLDEYAFTDNTKMDNQDNKDIVTIVSPFVGMVEFSNQIKLVNHDIYVHKGDVICSIEAMKIFNDIKAPASGTIVEILVEDCSLVEYEQPILKIRVDKNE
jgi:acetyl-CoA carboxylase biotin carboxyl carrier protein